MHAATYISSCVWSGGADGVTYQLVACLPLDLDRLRMYGCPCFMYIDKQLRRKHNDRAWKGVFVGYALDSPTYSVWNTRAQHLVCSCTVEFDELAVVGSTVMGEKIHSIYEDDYDSEDSGNATIQPHEDPANILLGDQVEFN
jgi:hypothetical protein